MDKDKHNEGSHMYAKGYAAPADVAQTVKKNHLHKAALLHKWAAKMQGRAGRFRGKNGAQENNKARGGKMAR